MEISWNLRLIFILSWICLTYSFSTRTATSCRSTINASGNSHRQRIIVSGRRDFLQQSSLLAGAAFASIGATTWNTAPAAAEISVDIDNVDGFQVFKTDSGLKYIDLEEGSAGDSTKTPRYGQYCIIS